MSNDLKVFLSKLKGEDFKGTQTKKSLKSKAEQFLCASAYEEYEKFNGLDIHNCLLCLIYDAV